MPSRWPTKTPTKFFRRSLPKRVVQRFLARPLRDLRKLKLLTADRLNQRLLALAVDPSLVEPLRIEQRVCMLIGARWRFAGFLLDTGLGKTLLACALIEHFRQIDGVKHALVLVPTRANKSEWRREIDKHVRAQRLPADFDLTVLSGTSKQKWEQLADRPGLVVVETYAGFVRMCCSKQPGKGRQKGRTVLRPEKKLLKRMLDLFDGFVLDESTQVGNRLALATRLLRQMRKLAKFAFAMTGTPFGRDPTMLFSQFYLIDQGDTLGQTLGLFRAALFEQHQDGFGRLTYSFPKASEPLLNRMLAHSSIAYEVDESTLPALIAIKKHVDLPKDADLLYREALDKLREAKHSVQPAQQAFTRMRQISSGFVGYDDDDLGRRAQFEFSEKPKLELLLATISSIDRRHKILVFVDFVFSGSMIMRELQKLDIGCARLYGGTKDTDAEINRWLHEDDCRVFVVNNQMAIGGNWQAARYGFFYECPLSPISRKQARRRFERQGSEHSRVFQYDLISRGTMDEAILRFVLQGENLFDAIIRGKHKL